MRTKIDQNEVNRILQTPSVERLSYFLHSLIETEEVWGVGDESGWILKELSDGSSVLPIWPHREFTTHLLVGDWEDQTSKAVSLEHFVYEVLAMLKKNDIPVEVFPIEGQEGEILSAQQMFETLEGMIDAGEYYMEG